MMRQHIKLSAVLVVVVLALTGFSTSSHGGRSGKSKSRGSSSSGGGCSNSKKSNGSYHSSDYDDNDSSSGSSTGNTGYETPAPSATASDEPQAYVFRCAQPGKGKRKAVTSSAVRLTAGAAGSHTYEVDVTFLDAAGNTVDTGEANVDVEGGETETVTVRMDSPRKVSQVKKCRVEAELSY
ncbi:MULTISPECIES: hypothetical protein [unclassified Streptomyces]|uniref:hypothetical protein n=1 Tax=unclassified Streptomyces TaxID=2593676 RepID=UPI0036E66BDD